MIVPISKRGRQGQPAPAPPPDVYAMMAAAQMQSEGRLLARDQSGTDAKLNSIPESEQTPVRV